MNQRHIEKWCRQNNWREPRQLASGSWVAFPPGRAVETLIPLKVITTQARSYLPDLIYGLILIVPVIIVTAIALVISPLFLPVFIQKHKQSRSMPGTETYNK